MRAILIAKDGSYHHEVVGRTRDREGFPPLLVRPKHELVALDFETFPIAPRPEHPPEPVGVALQEYGVGGGVYLRWGHPSGNNITKDDARRRLRELFRSVDCLVMHNAPFDLAVAHERLGLALPPWHKCHDTSLLLFLDDPRAPDFKLKPSYLRLFGTEPHERTRLIAWLVKHQPVEGVRLTEKNAGAYVAYAPGTLAAKYAVGDVSRTLRIFRKLYKPVTVTWGMREAYDRERKLWAGIEATERNGLRVSTCKLRRDVALYDGVLERLDDAIRRRLRKPDINLNSSKQLAEALLERGFATRASLGVTKTGNVRTSREALEDGLTDKRLLKVFTYRGQLSTCLSTFMRPWLRKALETGGKVYCIWRQYKSEGGGGAKSGRLASSPNFQNLPKSFAGNVADTPYKWCPPIPKVRGYVLPLFPDHVLINRDYSQQELRILAHFTVGGMYEAYQEDPWLDFHDTARRMINQTTGMQWPRTPVKNTGFGLLYGMGVRLLAKRIGDTIETARKLKGSYLKAMPDVKDLYVEIKRRAANDEPIRTWGGRLYWVEPPRFMEGQVRTFDYKLVNLLIQGSAGDQMKEAMVNYYDAGYHEEAPLLVTVHDELLASTPRARLRESMDHLRTAMESVPLDVPLLTEGKWSPSDWGALRTYDKGGKRVCRAK